MLSEEQVQEFHEKGYLNGGLILQDDEVEELREELDRILKIGSDGFEEGEPQPVSFRDLRGGGDGKASDTPVWQIVNIWEASEAYERLTYHPFINVAISQVTGHRDLQIWHDQIQYKPANEGGATTWHQDAPLWPIIKPMTPVSAWIPFDDADEENGCMWLVPGSHKWGNQIEFLRTQGHLQTREDFEKIEGFTPGDGADISDAKPEPWPVRKGEVSFHHSLTWHGSPTNPSPRQRRAIAIHYMTGEARYDMSGEHLMKQFVDLADQTPMSEAGPHFPVVCRDGHAMEIPERLRIGV
ncbi:MAG: phytanoyl-CoA dioxygenase family protein [Candidatus Latescibacterota bacterium]|nr:phytanoyl-CoA dioxygenase family protein [Candidatus Latescibacterota bacterium]